jgi:hypothetical protein
LEDRESSQLMGLNKPGLSPISVNKWSACVNGTAVGWCLRLELFSISPLNMFYDFWSLSDSSLSFVSVRFFAWFYKPRSTYIKFSVFFQEILLRLSNHKILTNSPEALIRIFHVQNVTLLQRGVASRVRRLLCLKCWCRHHVKSSSYVLSVLKKCLFFVWTTTSSLTDNFMHYILWNYFKGWI